MREAVLYEKLSDNRVRCNLCAHRFGQRLALDQSQGEAAHESITGGRRVQHFHAVTGDVDGFFYTDQESPSIIKGEDNHVRPSVAQTF